MLRMRSARRGAAESPDGGTGSAICSMSENRMVAGMLSGIAKRVPAGVRRTKFLNAGALGTARLEGSSRSIGKVLPGVTGGAKHRSRSCARLQSPAIGPKARFEKGSFAALRLRMTRWGASHSRRHLLGGPVCASDELVELGAAPGRLRHQRETADLRADERRILHRRLVPLQAARALLADHASARVAKRLELTL